ncbi:MAG: endonuclease, partial [Chitinophagaceae bacterium]
NDLLIFTEVKTRSGVYFGFPEDAVNKKKQEMLRTAALAFLGTYPDKQQLRFDVISIHMDRDREPAITHIEDAFY